MEKSKVTEATEGMRMYTLGGSVKANQQWAVQEADYRLKQEAYMEEISQIEELIARTSHSMGTCRFDS